MTKVINFPGENYFLSWCSRIGQGTNNEQQALLSPEICEFMAGICLIWKLEEYTNDHRSNVPIIPTF